MMMKVIKAIFICVLCFALVAVCITAGATSRLRGDADGDGEITISDATIIQRVLTEDYLDTDGSVKWYGNVTGGDLDILDVTMIQYYLAGFTDTLQIGEPMEAPTEEVQFPTQDNQLPILR